MKYKDVVFEELYIMNNGNFSYLKNIRQDFASFYYMSQSSLPCNNYMSHYQGVFLVEGTVIQCKDTNYHIRRIEL